MINKDNKMTNLNLDTNQSTDQMIAAVLPTLLNAIKEKAFVKGHKATDAEALGLVVSKFTQWDAGSILAVASEALEDANFDDLAQKIDLLKRV
tara:strand:- start:743 stop:1021 length:279 start_codon:yes stop_codon:yes gene_type:complete